MSEQKPHRPEHPAKVFLSAYRGMLKRKAALEQLRAEAYDRATSTSARLNPHKVSGGTTYDRMAEDIARAVDATERICQLMADIDKRLIAILDAIEGVSVEQQRLVLTLRYVNGYSWNEIARETHYEIRQVFRLHGEGLEAIRKIKNMSVNVSKCQ